MASVLFGICADVHQSPGYADNAWRVEKFIGEANERKADFIIQLGDFVCPDASGQRVVDIWNRFKGPRYHVLGNHDAEFAGKEAVMRFQGQPEKYYSFDCGNFHFAVLDTNYSRDNGIDRDYSPDNRHSGDGNCYVSAEELRWLGQDLAATNKRCFLFAHAALAEGDWVVYNLHELQRVLWSENQRAGYNKVTMCFSGHDHADAYLFQGGIHYLLVNSMSHKYIFPECARDSWNAEALRKEYGELRHVVPYRDPLYAFVCLKDNGLIRVIGKQSEYVGASPLEMHWEYYASPQITYREMWMNGFREDMPR